MDMHISLIYGSVRSARVGIKAASYLERKLEDRNIEVSLVDPLVYELPLLDLMYKEYEPGSAPASMEKLARVFRESDGFLLLTGEYNHGVPPALKNLLDHFQREYFFKPSAIASYSAGSFGGVRAAVQLRVIAGELGMPSIPSMLSFPKIGGLFDKGLHPVNPRIERSTDRFLDEFTWYIEAFKRQREQGTPY